MATLHEKKIVERERRFIEINGTTSAPLVLSLEAGGREKGNGQDTRMMKMNQWEEQPLQDGSGGSDVNNTPAMWETWA